MIYRNKASLIRAAVTASDVVLDVGFWGQGVQENASNWPHRILQERASEVYGLDLVLPSSYANNPRYLAASAEAFDFGAVKFDVIFAGDLIEHLSNPGLFLDACKGALAPDGRLVITTPNTFNLFNLTEKLTKKEPTVNPDHTFYFNYKVLTKLLDKNGWCAEDISYVYSLEYQHKESVKKKFLNILYALLGRYTDKFMETLVITAKARS